MGFFGIGTGEILLVIVVALIIWGPKKLPEIAKTMGKAMRTLKKASNDLTTTLTREIDLKDDKPDKQTTEKPVNLTPDNPSSATQKTPTENPTTQTTEKPVHFTPGIPSTATQKTPTETNIKSGNPEEHQQ